MVRSGLTQDYIFPDASTRGERVGGPAGYVHLLPHTPASPWRGGLSHTRRTSERRAAKERKETEKREKGSGGERKRGRKRASTIYDIL